MPRFKVSNCMH